MMDRRAWDERYAGDDLLWSGQPNRFLAEAVGSLSPGTALDLACGEGRNAVWLAEQGWKVTGIDFSAVALAKARRLADARGVEVHWVEADVVGSSAPWGSFDLVVVLYLHLPPPTRHPTFARAAEAVAPGGTLVVVGHDRANFRDGWGGPRDATVLYDADDVVTDVAAVAGLAVTRAGPVERPVDTDEGPKTAIDVVVVARRT